MTRSSDPTRAPGLRWRRRAATMSAGVALLTGCVGCAGGAGGGDDGASDADVEADAAPTATSAPTEAPELSPAEGPYLVGDCWQEDDYVTAVDWHSWAGTDAVDCAEPHNTITYDIGELPDDATYPYAGDEVDEVAWSAASDACGDVGEVLDLWKALPPLSRVVTFLYVPTPDQWADGARFVRCDVGLREWNLPESARALAPLDYTLTTLAAQIDGNPAGFEMCYKDVEGSDDSLLVSCSGDYSWRWLEDVDAAEHLGAAYPGEAGFQTLVHDRCSLQTLGPAPEYSCRANYPSEAEWAEGDTTIRIWTTKIG